MISAAAATLLAPDVAWSRTYRAVTAGQLAALSLALGSQVPVATVLKFVPSTLT